MAELSEEQRKALMEKLKNMSPEELKDFQKKQCIFCQIVGGKMEAKMVFEDDNVIAVLDINPANMGHILVMPKEHYAIMPQIPDDEMRHLGVVVKKLSLVLLKALKPQGTTVFIANGMVAGQRAQHFMIHIIPRSEKDGVGLEIPQREVNEDELRTLRESVQNKVNQLFGIKKEVVMEKKKKALPADEAKTDDFSNEKSEKKKENENKIKKIEKEEPPKERMGTSSKPSLDDIAELFK